MKIWMIWAIKIFNTDTGAMETVLRFVFFVAVGAYTNTWLVSLLRYNLYKVLFIFFLLFIGGNDDSFITLKRNNIFRCTNKINIQRSISSVQCFDTAEYLFIYLFEKSSEFGLCFFLNFCTYNQKHSFHRNSNGLYILRKIFQWSIFKLNKICIH